MAQELHEALTISGGNAVAKRTRYPGEVANLSLRAMLPRLPSLMGSWSRMVRCPAQEPNGDERQ